MTIGTDIQAHLFSVQMGSGMYGHQRRIIAKVQELEVELISRMCADRQIRPVVLQRALREQPLHPVLLRRVVQLLVLHPSQLVIHRNRPVFRLPPQRLLRVRLQALPP